MTRDSINGPRATGEVVSVGLDTSLSGRGVLLQVCMRGMTGC